MARGKTLTIELPTEVMKEIEKVAKNADDILGGMTKAGAEVVYSNIKASVPPSFRSSNIMKCLKITRTYKTPTDDGINTKVAFYGYFINHRGVRTPAPLVANVFEYGSTTVAKRPYLRSSFKKSQIERAMLDAQRKLSGGLLSE